MTAECGGGASIMGESMQVPRSRGEARIAVVGPVVPTVSPDGRNEPGGRAFTVARYLHELGGRPLLVTRVGRDAPGRPLVQKMQRLGMDVTGVQEDLRRPTDGASTDAIPVAQPSAAAFEALDTKLAARVLLMSRPSHVYLPTMALTSETVLSALTDLQSATGVPFFVDLDLDVTALDLSFVRRVLFGARWIKIRIDDLDVLVSGSEDRLSGRPGIARSARLIQRMFALESVVVDRLGVPILMVRGGRVVRGFPRAETHRVPPGQNPELATAALLVGLAGERPLRKVLRPAVRMAFRRDADSSLRGDHGIGEYGSRGEPTERLRPDGVFK